MKTLELTGAALDWAVAKCEGKTSVRIEDNRCEIGPFGRPSTGEYWQDYQPSTNWAEGWSIIERERIGVLPNDSGFSSNWRAGTCDQALEHQPTYGETPLVAAMRCYVASKLGDEVEIPEELLCLGRKI